MDNPMSLATAPMGRPLTLLRAEGTPDLCRRLAALGLRRGAQVRLVHRTAGGGRVLHVAGSRIALDKSMLRRLFVEPILTEADLPEAAA
ncbi:FeoA family protein [Luteococcus sp. H138]|uniref:FeoA family protein n=1 Tax=unclassified Luteococcus TaxID=2639923 RepID=UPI00313C5DC3